MKKGKWYWVSLPYATYGLRIRGGIVVEAPPIARWMKGRDKQEVMSWLEKKGARVVKLRVRHKGHEG